MEGHVRPLLPVAHALAGAGHDVRVATGAGFHERLRQAGLVPVLAGSAFEPAFALSERDPRFAEFSLTQRAAATFSLIIAPAKLVDLERIVAEWRPDLIVHECTDLAAPIVAAAASVPVVTQGWGLVPVPALTVPDPADLVSLWHARGLEADPYAGIFGSIHLHPMPTSLQPDARVPVGRLERIRLEMPPVVGASLPAWAGVLEPGRRPLIYVSLGTLAPFSRPEFLRTILKGLTRLDVEVVATVGAHNDPASLEPQPPNVHVERWLPLPILLPCCNLVVCHAGSGTLLATIDAGLPLVLLPRGADQFENAAACERAGVARVVAPESLTSAAVTDAVEQVLAADSCRYAAARLRAELEAMPAPSAVVPLLEQLAHGRSSASGPRAGKAPGARET